MGVQNLGSEFKVLGSRFSDQQITRIITDLVNEKLICQVVDSLIGLKWRKCFDHLTIQLFNHNPSQLSFVI